MMSIFAIHLLQGPIKKYELGGHEGVGSRPLSFPSLPPSLSRPLPLEVGPLNPARGSGGAM